MVKTAQNVARHDADDELVDADDVRLGRARRRPHAVIIVENMTVPPDRRVWQQARALRKEGWRVSVVTPKTQRYPNGFETIDGIDIYRHSLPLEARRIASYVVEYSAAIAHEIRLLLKIGLGDIDVIQICNPPDFLFLPALIAKKFGGAKVVFDHHDLTPELLVEKTGKRKGPLLRFARWAERQTFHVADEVISTNSAFRARAIEHGKKPENAVTIVYSSPDLTKLPPTPRPNPALKKGAENLLLWVGVMGSQDGLGLVLNAIAKLKSLPGGEKFHLLLAGDGPERQAMEQHADQLGLTNDVTFAGFLHGDDLAEAFATADIGLGSDPKNSFNDRLAMNKVLEYMAYELPIAMFDLVECKKIAGDAALYAANNDPAAVAANISNLIQSPNTRRVMGQRGHARLKMRYSWDLQKELYLSVFDRLYKSA